MVVVLAGFVIERWKQPDVVAVAVASTSNNTNTSDNNRNNSRKGA